LIFRTVIADTSTIFTKIAVVTVRYAARAARTHDDGHTQGGRRRVAQSRLAGVKALRWYILIQAG
jgi:hypothetical protein